MSECVVEWTLTVDTGYVSEVTHALWAHPEFGEKWRTEFVHTKQLTFDDDPDSDATFALRPATLKELLAALAALATVKDARYALGLYANLQDEAKGVRGTVCLGDDRKFPISGDIYLEAREDAKTKAMEAARKLLAEAL